jgi:hypothetical protein
MDQYEYTQDSARAGMVFGVMTDVENLVVPSGVVFEFGEAVFVDTGDEETAYKPDSTDASLVFAGVSIINHRCTRDTEEQYLGFREMDVLTVGQVYVPVASGIANVNCANKKAYVTHGIVDANYKKFTISSNGTYDIGAYFRSNVNADGLARVELTRGLN